MAAVDIPMNVVPAEEQAQNQQVDTAQPVDYLRVIQADSNNYGTLQRLAVDTAGTDAMVIGKLAVAFAPPLVWRLLNQIFLFRVQSVYVGLLSQMPTPAVEAQPNPVPAEFLISRFDPLLTRAFHEPSILGDRGDLLASTTRFKTSSPGLETLVIKYRHTKSGLVWCIAFLALASVAVGLLVGLLTKRADLGVGVSGGVGTLLTVIETVVFASHDEL